MQKTIVSWGIITLVLTFFAPVARAQKNQPPPPPHKYTNSMTWGPNHQYLSIDEDSSTHPPQTYVEYKSSDALYIMILVNEKPTSIYVNGRQVSADSFYLYNDLVLRVKEQKKRDSIQSVADRIQAGRDAEQAVRDKKQAERDAEQAERDKKQAEKDAEQAVRNKTQAERDAQQATRDKEQALKDAKQAAEDSEQAKREAIDAKAEADRDVEQAARDREQAKRDKMQAERDAEQAVKDKKQAERDAEQAVRDKKQAEEDRAVLKALLAEVVKEGLAPDEKSVVSLTLDGSVFFINGKKQSDELQKKFKEKFIKKAGNHIHFGTYDKGRVDD